MSLPNPVIVVPGVTASELRDEYPVSPESVWTTFAKSFDRVALHPDDLRYERIEPSRVTADHAFVIPYQELIEELRHDLAAHHDEPVPVYPFAYDWRMPLELTAGRLAAFVDEVIERTLLLSHYHRSPYRKSPKVNLVGHSMGGLVLTGYLAERGLKAKVGKVATLATPFRGSFEAVMKVTTGLATLGSDRSSSRERETARLTPSLYYLLPRIDGAVAAAPGIPSDLFDPGAWQPGVTQTIAEYVRLYGVDRSDCEGQAKRLFAELLSRAGAFRDRVDAFQLCRAGLAADDWLCVVGVGEQTRVRLQIGRSASGAPEFALRSVDRVNEWKSRARKDRVLTGDGTVPYEGARCGFIPAEKVVCVCDDDFGYWELADKVLKAAAGLHGILPKMNMVHRMLASHLKGVPVRSTWGRPAPDLLSGRAWAPPIPGLERK